MGKEVIIACDFPDRQRLFTFLNKFLDRRPFLKVGMELFYSEGPDLIRVLKSNGFRVFLDLKLYDIPNTVGRTIKNLVNLEVEFISIHASGGKDMMLAAKESACGRGTKLLAVTILTSISQCHLKSELLIENTLDESVKHFAKIAYACGIDGIVCSPFEVEIVKTSFNDLLCVTPGIRYFNETDDQKRFAQPAQAKEFGSDLIVVGRPITGAVDPVESYEKIKSEFI
ncbi:MAG: orotidine-5'-phosphate decarboxylase [Oscillospiraceae bacterium]|jgi:orotidine-5'-phosphate decarboxylase|nr:orotidine-5'-phosphate decarboxylase [Oscillospiraceae bacterium]